MIKLVVFDWNGTLLADTTIVFETFNKELHIFDHKPITLEEYRENRDVPLWRFYENLGINKKLYETHIQEVNKTFHANYELRASKTRTRRGTREMLQSLKNQKITSIILSNHTTEGIAFQLARLRLAGLFDEILANDDIHRVHSAGKQNYLSEYIKARNLVPSEILIVGDTVEEIEIGQNLGLKTAAITGGYNSVERLRALKPDVLVHTLRDIIPALEDI